MNAWHYEHSILREVKPGADLWCGLAIIQESRAGLSGLIYEGETQISFKKWKMHAQDSSKVLQILNIFHISATSNVAS